MIRARPKNGEYQNKEAGRTKKAREAEEKLERRYRCGNEGEKNKLSVERSQCMEIGYQNIFISLILSHFCKCSNVIINYLRWFIAIMSRLFRVSVGVVKMARLAALNCTSGML